MLLLSVSWGERLMWGVWMLVKSCWVSPVGSRNLETRVCSFNACTQLSLQEIFKLSHWHYSHCDFMYWRWDFLFPVLTGPRLVPCSRCLLNPIYPPTRHIWFIITAFFCSCCSYSIIKNPLNFNVRHKVCAPVNVSTDNYF